jgi:hypothetical protein
VSLVEIIWSPTTVWVNDDSGCCIGRFSPVGVDVHKTGAEQEAGGEQCLDCITGLPPQASWDRFVGSMLKHHDVVIPAEAKPSFVRRSPI